MLQNVSQDIQFMRSKIGLRKQPTELPQKELRGKFLRMYLVTRTSQRKVEMIIL